MSSTKSVSINRLAWAAMEIEAQVCPPSAVCMIPASRFGYCVPEAKTTFLEGDDMPQMALGSGGIVDVISVQVLPSCVRHKRCRRVIEPTQPSVGLVKLMHLSQVSASTVCWIVQVAPASSVCTIWPALLTPPTTCGLMNQISS